MQDVRSKVIRLRYQFTESPGGVMVYAINAQAEPQLSDQKAILQEAITNLRLPIAMFKYVTIVRGTRADGKGEVLVDGRESPPIIRDQVQQDLQVGEWPMDCWPRQ